MSAAVSWLRRGLLTAAAGQVLLRLFRGLRKSRRFAGLKDVVSFSSKMIAAQRALEHERSDRLFSDPLAAVLAGEQAMQRARERLRLRTQEGEKTGSERAGSKAMEGRIAVRTRYFDDAIVAALEGGAVQVVMLGAGMDTRPWRLRLPPGVAWFELDQADVMAAKLATMTAAGAQLRGGTSQGSGAKHPLMVATWSSVAADLCQPGWVEALVAAGFDAARPTVWAAEGLLMYLPEDAVRQLLTTARAISAPGSRATFSMVNDAATAYAQQSGSELTSTWKWGLPEGDAGLQFFRECGWATEHLDQLGDARASYGRYAVAPQPADTPGARRTLYWQGHPA